jgi:flagellar biosynthesis component FlhA
MHKKIFPWIISLSALSVSGSAAFYSVYGLGKMFAGAVLEVMILAGTLEFAKLVTASLLYQYWKTLNVILKFYLLIATFVLICITSAGIYGFLSSAYQETAFKVQTQDQVVNLLDQEKTVVESEIKTYQNQSEVKNNRISQLITMRIGLQSSQDALITQNRSTSAIRQQIKDVDTEIKRLDEEHQIINDSISSKNRKISNIELQKLEITSNEDIAKEIGPLKYIAGLTGKPLDVVVNWYILVLMIVFDPLAIALVIAANFAFEKARTEKEIKEEVKGEKVFNTQEQNTEEKNQEEPLVHNTEENTPINQNLEKNTEFEEKTKKTKNIIFESGQVKKIIEEDKGEIQEKQKNIEPLNNTKKKEIEQVVDKYTKYIRENTPGFRGFKHNSDGNL